MTLAFTPFDDVSCVNKSGKLSHPGQRETPLRGDRDQYLLLWREAKSPTRKILSPRRKRLFWLTSWLPLKKRVLSRDTPTRWANFATGGCSLPCLITKRYTAKEVKLFFTFHFHLLRLPSARRPSPCRLFWASSEEVRTRCFFQILFRSPQDPL